MYVPIPTAPPQPPSPEAQELGGHLANVINAYQADHPDMSPLEIRQAIRLARQSTGGPNTKLLFKALAVGLLALFAAGLLVFRANPDIGPVPWRLAFIGVLIVVLGITVVLVRKQ